MIRHGVTRLPAPRRDVAALKASLKDLSQHPAKRQEMGAKSREIALQESPCPSKPDDTLSCTSPSSRAHGILVKLFTVDELRKVLEI